MRRLELEIAWRYMRSRRGSRLLSLISVIAIGGVIVGVAALIVIMAVMTGLQKDLKEKILVGSPDIRVLNWSTNMVMPDSAHMGLPGWRTVLDSVRRLPGVVAAGPAVLSKALVRSPNNHMEAAQVVGIPPEARDAPEVTTIRQHALPGDDFKFASSDGLQRGIVVGRLLADRLGVLPGDTLILLTPTGSGISVVTGWPDVRADAFEVTGIFDTGMYEYDNGSIYMALRTAQAFAGLGDGVTGIEVRAVSRDDTPEVRDTIIKAFGEFNARVIDWQQQNDPLFKALRLEKLAMGVILLLVVVVAAFNIVSTLTMVVTDKTREIGILRAMGMRASSIRRIFLAQGIVIGVVGTAIGLVVGLAAAIGLGHYKWIKLPASVYFIDHLPATTDPADVILTVLASLAIAAVATMYPAVLASRLYPIEAIRHE
jgi:lipoprotein-releasing system permease protein